MTMLDAVHVLALPAGARVDRRVPKALLLQHGAPTAADKRRITDGVKEVRWLAVLKPATVGIAAYRDAVREYLEIPVLALTLRPGVAAQRLMELMHRAVPYPAVLITLVDDLPSLSLVHKRWARNDRTHVVLDGETVTIPLPCGPPDALGCAFFDALALSNQPRTNLCTVYGGWLDTMFAFLAARVTGVFSRPADPAGAATRRYALREYERLESTIAALRGDAVRTSQLYRRVAINLEIRRLCAERDAVRARL